ncbi:MAG TPA: AsmA family protein [Alphaproteobacteria bacterium]|nr:AsmA family protein [Alphaproteobacteria bacterium]
MKKLLIGLTVALSLVVTAVLVVPGFIDWNGYRDQIAGQLSALVGRTVTIGGEVDFALLPTPILSARDVRVANPENAAFPEMMTIGALDVRVALLPLLSGRVEAERIILIDPVVVLETLPDGSPAWPTGGEGVQPRDVQLDRVTVENGTVLWHDGRTGRDERIDDVFAQFSARSLAGPFQLIGSLSVRDRRLTVDLSAGRLSSAGAAAVNATIGLDGAAGELRFNGLVAPDPLRLQGDLRAEGGDLADMLARLAPGVEPPSFARRPFEATATLLATSESTELNALSVEVGDTRTTGAVSLSLSPARRIDVALRANRWDLDALFADRGETPAGLALPDTFRLPDAWTATVDVSVDALTWRGALIRDARLEGVLSDGVVALNALSAEMPGGSKMSLVGTLRAEGGAPYADLSGRIEANDLRRLLDWAGYPLEEVPGSRLRRVVGEARLAGSPRQFTLTGVDVTLDGSHVTGGLAYIDQGRPGFGLRLGIDRLDLDAYWPGGRVPLAEDEILQPLILLAGEIDANVDATIGSITVAGTTFDDVRLDGTLSGGGVTLRRAGIGSVAGASVGLAGTVASLDPLGGIDLTLDFKTDRPSRFTERFGIDLPVPAERLAPVTLDGRVQGEPERLSLQLTTGLAGGTAELGGAVERPFGEPRYDLAVRVGHPSLATAVGVLAPGYVPRAELSGLDLYAEISGPPDRLSFDNLQGLAGPVSLAGEAVLDRTGARPMLDADLRTSAIAVEDFLPAVRRGRPPAPDGLGWSSVPLDFSALDAIDAELALTAAGIKVDDFAIDDPAARFRLEDGGLVLEGLSGGLFGGRLGMAGRLHGGEDPELSISLDLVGAELAPALAAVAGLDGLAGTLDFGTDLTAEAGSVEELMASLAGEGMVAVRDGAADGFDLARAGRQLAELSEPLGFLDVIRQSLSEGRTPFASLNATFAVADGVAHTHDIRLVADAGIGEGRGTVDLSGWQVEIATEYTLRDHPEVPPFGIVLAGALDDPQRRLQTQALQAHIAQRAAEALSERFREPATDAPADAMEPEPAGPRTGG